jgi:hypothetical protein
MLAPMQWDGVTLRAFAGVAAMIVSGVLLLAGVGVVVPMMGFVAGIAAMLGASLERLKLRVEALERNAACNGQRQARRGGWLISRCGSSASFTALSASRIMPFLESAMKSSQNARRILPERNSVGSADPNAWRPSGDRKCFDRTYVCLAATDTRSLAAV